MPEGLLQKVGNGLMFNISWLLIVSSESALIGVLVAAGHLLVHHLWMGRGQRELEFIAALTVFGLLLDHFLFAMGVFTLDGVRGDAPLWLSCLWPVLATTLNHAFAMLQHNLLLAGILGGIGGLGSYYAGTAMSQVDFADPVIGPVVITLLWAALFPLLALGARLHVTESAGGPELA